MSEFKGSQRVTVNCLQCHTQHFADQILNNYRCIKCKHIFPYTMALLAWPEEISSPKFVMDQNELKMHWETTEILDLKDRTGKLAKEIAFLRHQRRPEELDIIVGNINRSNEDYSRRLAILEDLFAGKSFKPIHDAMNSHIEMFNKRIEALESSSAMNSDSIGVVDSAYDEACRAIEKRLDAVEAGNQRPDIDFSTSEEFLSKLAVPMNQVNVKDFEKMYPNISDQAMIPEKASIKECQSEIEELHRIVKCHGEVINQKRLSPFKCPACDGKGIYKLDHISMAARNYAEGGFEKCVIRQDGKIVYIYADGSEVEIPEDEFIKTCKPCKGEGVLWK